MIRSFKLIQHRLGHLCSLKNHSPSFIHMASIQLLPQPTPPLKPSPNNLLVQNADNITFLHNLRGACNNTPCNTQLPPLRSPRHVFLLPTSQEVAAVPSTDASSAHINGGRRLVIPPRKSKESPSNTTSDVLRLVDCLNVSLSSDVYASLIKECTFLRDPEGAVEVYRHLRRSGLKPSSDLLNRVMLVFISCGRVDIAEHLFDEMPERDFNSWAVVVVGCMECGDYEGATRVFARMCYCLDMSRTPVWLVACVLDACVNGMDMEVGEQIHGWLLKQGRYHDDMVFAMLFKLYGRFRQLRCANFVFDQLSRHTKSIWTEKMMNDFRGGDFIEVVNDFNELGRFGKGCSQMTLSSVIKACGRINDAGEIGRQVHAKVIKVGMEDDEMVGGGLVGMYGKFGMLRNARMLFDAVRDCRNIRCWNDMIKGYVQHGLPVEAIKLLYQMKAQGLEVDEHLLHEVRIAAGS